MTKQHWQHILKYSVYILFVFAVYIVQCTPRLLVFEDVKPLLLLPAVLCVSFFEGEYTGGVLAVLAGILCDFSSPTLFGFNALYFLFVCVAAGLMTIYFMRPALLNAVLLVLAALFLRALLEFLFSYAVYDLSGLELLFYTRTAPAVVYSAAFTPLFYWLAKGLHRLFDFSEEKEAAL